MADSAYGLNSLEIAEWKTVNRNLRHHGLPAVELLHPHQTNSINEVLVLEAEGSKVLREVLQSLLRDCDRRQELIQQLITTNNKLRQELQEQMDSATKYEGRTRDLRAMLNNSQDKVKELEESILNITNTEQSPRQKSDNSGTSAKSQALRDAQSKCEQLQKTCELQQQVIIRLSEKLTHSKLQKKGKKKKKFKPSDHTSYEMRTTERGMLIDETNQIPDNKTLTKFAAEVLELASSNQELLPVELRDVAFTDKHHKVWCEKTQHHILVTLAYWQDQILQLKKLQDTVNSLGKVYVPWRKINLKGAPSSKQIINALEIFLLEDPSQKPASQKPKTMKVEDSDLNEEIVRHFMLLFSVKKISGVFARMNEIYTKLGESANMLRALNDTLGLDKEEKAHVVVGMVDRLCHLHRSTTSQQLKELLHTDDLNSVLSKLKDYEDFFPVFNSVITRLMEILEVQKLDRVVPAVRALKVMAAR